MQYRYTLALALLGGAAAQSAPLPNLPLTCSDENSIGQEACEGIWSYEIPTNDLIVASGNLSSYVWVRASDLAGSNPVAICTLPVEPGEYSSCRDETGVRRITYVPKDTVFPDGSNSVTVSKTGGDYTDPVTAAANAFAGDTWCVAPQWPEQPCVMQIAQGIFILPQTLMIPEGLAVAGAGKGDTILVADNDVETAVSSLGNVRINSLTIVNNQPNVRAGGLFVGGPFSQVRDVAIHVGGAMPIAIYKDTVSLEILDSDIDSTGYGVVSGGEARAGDTTIERSRISAPAAIYENISEGGREYPLRLVDSSIFGEVFAHRENSLLEVARSVVVGSVIALNGHERVVINDSTIEGDVLVGSSLQGQNLIVRTNVEGELRVSAANTTVDGLTVHGQLRIGGARASVLRSYVSNPENTPALSALSSTNVLLEQTLVQGSQAVAFPFGGALEVLSSVLAGPVSATAGTVLVCTDTFGADYELLSDSCQPQAP